MKTLCIKNNNLKTIDYLMNQISNIDLDDIIFSKRDFSKYTNIIIHYKGNNIDDFYDKISCAICNCIIDIYEPIILRNTLLTEYFYFDIQEIKQIEDNCNEILYDHTSTNSNIKSKFHFPISKKENKYDDRFLSLWIEILKYLLSNHSIILDGFIHFRTREYRKYIEDAIDNSVNQFVIDKEYHDFINLIQLYINSKPSNNNTVYLIYKNGESILLDEKKEPISCNKEVFNTSYLSDISFSSNDYTLNSLLTLLPSKLIIHLQSPEDEFITTLKLIFLDRIIILNDSDIANLTF